MILLRMVKQKSEKTRALSAFAYKVAGVGEITSLLVREGVVDPISLRGNDAIDD